MKVKTVTLDSQTREVLMRSRIEGNNLFLPGQLARPDYVRVAKAIEAAGGKWNRKAGCHVFLGDVRETLNISADMVEVVNVQQTFQAFNTPDEIANQMCQLAVVLRAIATLGQRDDVVNACRERIWVPQLRVDLLVADLTGPVVSHEH